MFQLKPGSMAMIIGARTASGRRNIGKSVELFGLCQPGLRFVNPVNGVMTQLPSAADRALWLVTGDVYAFDNQLITNGVASRLKPGRDSVPCFSRHRGG